MLNEKTEQKFKNVLESTFSSTVINVQHSFCSFCDLKIVQSKQQTFSNS